MFPRKQLAGLVAFLALAGIVLAHPEEFTERLSGAELAHGEHLTHKRHLAARNCASSINAFHKTRRAKRSLSEQIPLGGLKNSDSTEDAIHSSTCVTAPEVEEGPYYVNNELVRQDLVEDQGGVTLRLDIGVIDTATCEPIPDAFVEIWSANATGFYGAFEKNTHGSPPGRGDGPNRPPRHRHPVPGRPGGPDRPGRDRPGPDRPGRGGPGRGGPGRDRPGKPGPPHRGGGGPSMSSNSTWLRGGFPTDTSGVVELTTIYPGFYPGRTVHVHLMVRTDWAQAPNGTLISHAGNLKHIGQLFFDESWNDQVLGLVPYTENKARRTLNVRDHDFARAIVDGSTAIVELELLGNNVEEGLLGFITIGVDLTTDYSIHSGNYYNSTTDADLLRNVASANM